MSFRQRLLIIVTLLVTSAVGVVSWIFAVRARRAFEQVDHERTSAVVAQFHSEFERRQASVSEALERLARTDLVQRIAFDAAHAGDLSPYVRDASTMASEQQLDFLDLVTSDGTIVTSAEWPAHFAYKLPAATTPFTKPRLERVELPDGNELGLIAVHAVSTGDGVLYLYGGKRLDKGFLQDLSVASGASTWMYRVSTPDANKLDPSGLIGDAPPSLEALRPLLAEAIRGNELSAAIKSSRDRFDRITVQAIPLKDDEGKVSAVLLVGTSRRPLLLLEQQIRLAGFGIAGLGILLSIAAALWISARLSRPVEQLAQASRQIATGNWSAQVEVTSNDELGELGESFNSMASQLTAQREKLVQAERVAAWRELARRLAHELKNPLFPLQITVENLMRSRALPPKDFDEIFEESTSTLLAELTHLKTIIARFSDFSKMPKPQIESVNLNETIRRIQELHSAQLAQSAKPISLRTELDETLGAIQADPELLYRVLSNLVLNAVDAMPGGGVITLRTSQSDGEAVIEVRDTGLGMTPEESERLFTPYYTTKQHGTGLGLAIAQSVIADHHGTIHVVSEKGKGSAFVIHLPKRQPEAVMQQGAAQ